MWLVAFLHQYEMQTLIKHKLFFRLNIKAAAFCIFYSYITCFLSFCSVLIKKQGLVFEKFIYLFLTYRLKLSFKLKIKQKGSYIIYNEKNRRFIAEKNVYKRNSLLLASRKQLVIIGLKQNNWEAQVPAKASDIYIHIDIRWPYVALNSKVCRH